MSANHEDDIAEIERPVGPFTGFGNFFRKEVTDWWKSWRLIVVFIIPTLITVLIVFTVYDEMERSLKRNQNREEVRAERNAGPAGKNDGAIVRDDRDKDRELPIDKRAVATVLILFMFIFMPLFYVFIIIFSTMGLLTTEKSTGTLAWNLTKPLGRTGLFIAKWLAATLMLWLACCFLPVFLSSLALKAYHGVFPEFDTVFMVVAVSFAWVGFWVLMVMMISLGFQSQAAVGGIALACFLIPFLFFDIMGEVFGKESRDLVLDRWAPRSPSWAFPLVARGVFRNPELMRGLDAEKMSTIWVASFIVWFTLMSAFSLRIFNRQEIGS